MGIRERVKKEGEEDARERWDKNERMCGRMTHKHQVFTVDGCVYLSHPVPSVT